jgi:hypothetical protein
MKKGVSVDQVARVTKAFTDAGILVHAYLMYGFPTQTVQDTVDALEYVRQLFANGCIQSGFFHRFACTVHSPVGKNPEDYGVTLAPLPPGDFAKNDVAFIDPTGVDHDALGGALKKAIYNYMHGIGLEEDVRMWFPFKVPKTTVRRDRIERALHGIAVARIAALGDHADQGFLLALEDVQAGGLGGGLDVDGAVDGHRAAQFELGRLRSGVGAERSDSEDGQSDGRLDSVHDDFLKS